eukprot:358371-Amphidinium_carterae.1
MGGRGLLNCSDSFRWHIAHVGTDEDGSGTGISDRSKESLAARANALTSASLDKVEVSSRICQDC